MIDKQKIFTEDNVDMLKSLDMDFPSHMTELAVKHKAVKCLEYLLVKGTPLSQFCFLRASENNFYQFATLFIPYYTLDDNLLIKAYTYNSFLFFKCVLPWISHKQIREFVKHYLADVMSNYKQDPYLETIIEMSKELISPYQLLRKPHLLKHYKVNGRLLRKVIKDKIRLPLDLDYPKTCYLPLDFNDDDYDLVSYYAVKISFVTMYFKRIGQYCFVKSHRRRLVQLLLDNH
jgi:hypothetical protein